MANVFGTDASETLNAFDGVTNGADTIFGFGGNDSIFGLGGNDEIKGGGGADAVNGGAGTDTANYSDSGEGVVVSLESGQGFGGTAEGDTLVSIENLTGSAHDDWLTGNAGNNVLAGLEDNDVLKGGGGSDTLYGDSGNDTLKGGGGADALNGGSGIDTASYAESPAGVFISLITDTADWGDATGDELNSIENVTGSGHDDTLWGNDGTNVLKGMDGDDSLKGFGGADTLHGGDGNDLLDGMDGGDTLYGNNGNDTLRGGAGFDMLQGGAGNDTIIGGADKDTMYGGAGADVFRFESVADAPAAGYLNTDYIPDFDALAGDRLDFSLIDANVGIAGDQAFSFIGNEAAFTGSAGELRFTGGFVEGDVNGDAAADFQIELDVASVNAWAFIL